MFQNFIVARFASTCKSLISLCFQLLTGKSGFSTTFHRLAYWSDSRKIVIRLASAIVGYIIALLTTYHVHAVIGQVAFASVSFVVAVGIETLLVGPKLLAQAKRGAARYEERMRHNVCNRSNRFGNPSLRK